MKRTELKRYTPLRSHTRLKCRTGLRRSSSLVPRPSSPHLRRSHFKPCRKPSTLAAADKAWEYDVKERAGFTCEVGDPAGCCEGLHSHHVIGRRHRATRHDLRNGVACCPNCHDNRKVLPWLQRTDPGRYEWIMEHRHKVCL